MAHKFTVVTHPKSDQVGDLLVYCKTHGIEVTDLDVDLPKPAAPNGVTRPQPQPPKKKRKYTRQPPGKPSGKAFMRTFIRDLTPGTVIVSKSGQLHARQNGYHARAWDNAAVEAVNMGLLERIAMGTYKRTGKTADVKRAIDHAPDVRTAGAMTGQE